jgi:hypothetical protein
MGAFAHAGKEREHLILHHQCPDCLNRSFRLEAVIPNPEFNLPAVDTTKIIDILEPRLCGVSDCREF